MTTNRNPLIKYFITYPQSHDTSKLNFLETAQELNLKYYIICQETHLDGNPHLHALLWLKKAMTKAKLLKFFKEKYPNNYKRIDVQSVRNLKASIKYCRKEDPSPLEHPDGPPIHHRAFKYPQKMVVDCQLIWGCHPRDLAQEYRNGIRLLKKRKKEIENEIELLLRDYPETGETCDILEKELKRIVFALFDN